MRTFRVTFYPGELIKIEVLVVADSVDQAKDRAAEKILRLIDRWKAFNIYVPWSFREVMNDTP